MINAKQLIKIGRSSAILEANDHLQVNDFYNESGYQYTTLHGKFSKVNIAFIDTREGNKEKAKVYQFNFDTEAINDVVKVFGINGLNGNAETINAFTIEKFKERAMWYNTTYNSEKEPKDYLHALKINCHEKLQNNANPVTSIKLSYEEKMQSEYKFKIAFEKGYGEAEEGQAAFRKGAIKKGTYKKISESYLCISWNELKDIIICTVNYISLWEKTHMKEMLENRALFEERASRSNFNEATMDVWNKRPSTTKYTTNNVKKDTNNINQQANIKKENLTYKGECTHCKKKIAPAASKYSLEHYNEELCCACMNSTTLKVANQ